MAEFKIDDEWKNQHPVISQVDFNRMTYKERLDLYKNNRELYDSLISSERMKHPAHNHSEALQELAIRPFQVCKMIIRKR